jgi:hypothetical protein
VCNAGQLTKRNDLSAPHVANAFNPSCVMVVGGVNRCNLSNFVVVETTNQKTLMREATTKTYVDQPNSHNRSTMIGSVIDD